MKKQLNFKLLTFLLVLTLSFSLISAGCGDKDSSSESSKKSKEITVKDSKGVSVKLKSNPKRVVVINNSVAEIMCALEASDKIVGVSDTTKFPEYLTKKEKVGAAFTPSVEKIMQLKPDLVFGYGEYLKKEDIDKIKAAGIDFISIDGYRIKTLGNDIKTIGKILGKEKRADEYAAFINENLNKVKDKVGKLKPEEKVPVYWEGYTDFSTVSKGSGGDEILELAGVKNIAGSEPVAFPKISAEYVVQKNPKLIVKQATTSSNYGYGVTDPKGLNQIRDKITKRTGWNNIDAVKDSKVYVLSSEIATSARGVVGICYVAKLSYPDLFKDLDPDAIHKEFLQKFYGLDYKGCWISK